MAVKKVFKISSTNKCTMKNVKIIYVGILIPINIILISIIHKYINPHEIDISRIDYLRFDYKNLFPVNLYSLFYILFSFLNLIIINSICIYQIFKKKKPTIIDKGILN